MIWLPFASSKANLEVLTDEHVFEVVFEGMQCLRNVYAGDLDWRDARAWSNAPAALLAYVARAEREMVRRGYPPEPRVIRAQVAMSRAGWSLAPVPPWWFGHPAFHLSQRSHLIRVNPTHYTRRMPFTTPLELPVIWPGEKSLG
jgi:hypothetical protein